jgi:hypothetical protein
MMMKRMSKRKAFLAFALLMTLWSGLPVRGRAQIFGKQQAPVQRIADGKVVSKGDVALANAVVYLKDTKSSSVRTFITDAEGHFHFGQLNQNTDYELWAESDGTRSSTKGISSFDSKNYYSFILKIAK